MAGDRKGAHFLIGKRVNAQYQSCEEPMYRHNCYIEALPPALEPEKAASLMKRMPAYEEDERNLPVLRRLQAVQKIANCIIPLPEFIEFEQKFYRMVCNGYLSRNPLSEEWTKQIRSGFPDLDWDRGTYEYEPLIRSTAAGFSVIGPSGVGKSTLLESIIPLYPQVIVHSVYNGQSFDQQQLVWLKLDCPFDGSPRGLCSSFFRAIDKIMGTRYAVEHDNRRRSADDLLPIMAIIAGVLGLGVLVIDEIQRLKEANSGGAQKILNFFVQLTNTIGVPVILMGTYKAFSLFKKEFALARRITGQGDVIIHNFAHDEYWDYFLTSIWKYQWTKKAVPLTQALNNAIYEQSQGIVDIAIKLYMLAQWHVIGSDDERITAAIIKEVAKENLHVVEPILRAIRENDLEELEKIEDIRIPLNALEEHLMKAMRRTSLQGVLNSLKNQTIAARAGDVENAEPPPVEHLSMLLVQAGYNPETALESARMACNRFAAATDMKLASSEAFRLAAENEAKKEANKASGPEKPRKIAKIISLSGDLRAIVKAAAKGVSPYQALKEAGSIKPATEFLAAADM